MKRKKALTDEQIAIIDAGNKVTDEEAWREFLVSKEMIGVSDNTMNHYETIRRVVYRDMPYVDLDKSMMTLTRTELEALIIYWKTVVKIPTINSRIRVLKTYYNTLKKRKIIKYDPMIEIHQLKEKEVIKETLTSNEISLIAKYFKSNQTFANYRNLVLFELLLDTGLRISEALAIKNFNVADESIIINETKSRQQRMVYPSEHCLKTLNTYKKVRGIADTDYLFITVDGTKLSKRQFQGVLNDARKAMKIDKPVSPHTLRRTYAKHAVMNGIDPFSLARLLGHEDLNTTKRYVQIYGTDLKKQSKKRGAFDKYL